MKKISREQAQKKGLKRFFDGVPCKHGHIAERYISKGRCCECTKNFSFNSFRKLKYKGGKPRNGEIERELLPTQPIKYYGLIHNKQGVLICMGVPCINLCGAKTRRRALIKLIEKQNKDG